MDPKEIEVFQDLSKTWWENPGLQTLRNVNKKIAEYIYDELMKHGIGDKTSTLKPLKGIRVLEVGCGGGFLTEDLARSGCDLTAIEPNKELLTVAKYHAASDPTLPKIKYLEATVEDYYKDNVEKYDVVISNFALEHVNDHELFIKCCAKLVKPGGHLFISAIAKTYLAWFVIIFLKEYVLRTLPIGLHNWHKLINASITEDFIKSCGFDILRTQGAYLDFITGTAFWVSVPWYAYITHAVGKIRDEKSKQKMKLTID